MKSYKTKENRLTRDRSTDRSHPLIVTYSALGSTFKAHHEPHTTTNHSQRLPQIDKILGARFPAHTAIDAPSEIRKIERHRGSG